MKSPPILGTVVREVKQNLAVRTIPVALMVTHTQRSRAEPEGEIPKMKMETFIEFPSTDFHVEKCR